MAYVARGCGGCHPDPHASALGLDCKRCHEMDWTPTGLIAEHNRMRFHLVAAHAVAPCESCHLQAAVGQYKGAPVQCELCHQRSLAQANSPDHLANGWTADCERCHTPAGWTGADFEHYFFPLEGPHNVSCELCHTGADKSTFDHLNCHEKGDTDDDHDEVDGYSYDSQECYRCHPDGDH